MKEEIVELLQKKKKLTPYGLGKAMHIRTEHEKKELQIALNELEDERIIYNDHEKYVFIDGQEWVIGKIKDVSATEYAVLCKENKLYVPKKNCRMMMDKDEVLVHNYGLMPEVVHIYERGITCIPGTFVRTRNGLKFRSDVDLHTSFIVTNQKAYKLSAGTKAVVKVVDYSAPLRVKIIAVLGREDEPGVDISAILAENEVRQNFGKKVRAESDEIPERVHKKEMKDRHDLRDLMTVTIDGDSTKDFDDAISVEALANGGWKLYVHIADVSHYVKEDSDIDNEAYKRGTSIYVADRVVPMLPFALSNGICSLNPGVDRLTLTCAMEFNPNGVMTDYEIYESVIHSDARCTYSKVNAYLDNPQSVPEYAPVGNLLTAFSDLAKKMREQTEKRGHIDFETKEPKFVLDERGVPVDILIRDRGWSEMMIEEAMIAANVAVAHELHSKSLPGMFRIHEDPDPEKLQTLVNMASILHVPCDLDVENCQPKDVARFLASIEGEEEKEILSTITVRSMQKARYSEKNVGHYGLALDEYCHFTSPIRRYPDLLIHRMLRRHVIHKKNDEKSLLKDEKRMEKSSMHLSEKEKDAVTIERAVNDLEFAKYMENKVGEVYDGLIVGVTSFGFFVELDNTVEGMVPLRNMIDDFYNYDADTMMLTGENTGKTFTLGMPVRIKVRDVQTAKRQITFDYLETLPSRSAMRPSTPVIETAEPKPEEQPEEEILQAEIVSEERDANVTITETEVQTETPAKEPPAKADSEKAEDLPAVEAQDDDLPAVESEGSDLPAVEPAADCELPATEPQESTELPIAEPVK